MGAEKTLPENAAGARQGRYAVLLRHAGTDRGDRPVQEGRRVCRQRSNALPPARLGAGRQVSLRAIPDYVAREVEGRENVPEE